ncbi:uridine diphosphate-N-acetylglucosamine-binding protein YvcK [Pseudarthrobacter sp. J75]|uniref:gluconeogenesis factor YvcK family protein n=1 Tax=unclassified Pseudarthrobacter TaxID=2647000 RepID=UPI002E81C87A|nr:MULTISPECIES: uridine diphosphate-N-acetylglucosamine-binding protein YvcK [unclassified Pseudarthrobacter]MEE2523039.1 uridine diphosphate-N-acetylglucosamine-binding protein YvcK [Pseudarthrobacter sp. J47]MEE2529722.1 uridine diphosphate-N-acetylglucosamine-binding protein YvcK [Pseudarthrobacter sp. J75]
MGMLTGPLPLVPPAKSTSSQQSKGPTVVALGGGHGLSASLSALRLLTSELTAVVTVADDGGSSGRLREEYGVLPPGDLRMALSALCDDTDWGRTWRDVMQHRFRSANGKSGSLDEHAMGNLLIVTLWELLGDAVDGLKWAGALLGARGQVLPMSTVPLTIEGDIRVTGPDGEWALQTIRGQARCAVAGSLERVRLVPEAAPACIEALTAIELADWVVLGPGSWYTSVLPHLLLPEMRQALCDTPAKRCLTMNLATDTRETSGMTAADHLYALRSYAPDFSVDVVLADPASVPDRAEFEKAAGMIGAEVVLGRVGAAGRRPVHDPLRLATAYHDIFGNS